MRLLFFIIHHAQRQTQRNTFKGGKLLAIPLAQVCFSVCFKFLESNWVMGSLIYRKAVALWCLCMQMGDSGLHFGLKLLERSYLALSLFIFAMGGAVIGGIAGAMKGQTTETGLCRGAAIGVISGAIVALEILESVIHGHFLSKVALFGSILNGKAFREWVSPAILKAYLWQTSMLEGNGNVARDIYDMDENRGLLPESITRLPAVSFCCDQVQSTLDEAVSCTICLQDLVEDERMRILPKCEHMFHVGCIDEWLVISASCPVCRNQVDC